MITQKRLDKFLETGKDQCLSIERSKKHCSLIVYKNQIVSAGVQLCMPWCKMYFDSIYYTMPEGVVKLEY